MIRHVINVDNYWKIIVYYNVDYNLFDYVAKDLSRLVSLPVEKIDEIRYNLQHKAKAVTVSSIHNRTSVVVFNRHVDKYDYINSIVHEAEHVKQAMLKAYKVADEGEPPAYTIGYLVMKMLMSKIMKNFYLKNS